MSKLRDKKSRDAQGTAKGQERHGVSVHASGGSHRGAAVAAHVPLSLSTVAEISSSAHDRIAARAYRLWEANGRPAGTDQADWFEAERLLCTEG